MIVFFKDVYEQNVSFENSRLFKNANILREYLLGKGVECDFSFLKKKGVCFLSGEIYNVDDNAVRAFPFVEKTVRTELPYKLVTREYKKENTVVSVNGKKIGDGSFTVIAGPCAVESEEQIISLAKKLKSFGISALRGGAFKPRTSPYTFQGLGVEGLKMLSEAKRQTGLPIVSEVPCADALKYFDDVDVLQIGARNMQNYSLLCEIGSISKPVLLKRGMGATVKEWLLSAEYVMKYGNENVILCERGIRTFETDTRSTLDFTSLPLIKKNTHLPVIVDPSNSTGDSSLVRPMSLAAACVGADGIIVEVSEKPEEALCDGVQAVTSKQVGEISSTISKILPLVK